MRTRARLIVVLALLTLALFVPGPDEALAWCPTLNQCPSGPSECCVGFDFSCVEYCNDLFCSTYGGNPAYCDQYIACLEPMCCLYWAC